MAALGELDITEAFQHCIALFRNLSEAFDSLDHGTLLEQNTMH